MPDKLKTEPNDERAEKHYIHWKKTFENFLQDCGNDAPDKLRCLTRYISSDVYEHIADSTSYEEAVQVLDSLYIKTKNDIFMRHKLASRKQETTESLE